MNLIIRKRFKEIALILGIVTALSFFQIFYEKAKIEIDIPEKIISCNYDESEIKAELRKHGLNTALDFYHKTRDSYVVAGPQKYFDRNSPIIDLIPDEKIITSLLAEFKAAVKFTPQKAAANYKKHSWGPLSANIDNRGYWESFFIDSLSTLLDQETLIKTIGIVLAHRKVTTIIGVYNSGRITAKDIQIIISCPYLLNPHSYILYSRVEILDVGPLNHPLKIENNRATIEIKYLKPNVPEEFYVITSFTNVTKENIYINFDSNKELNLRLAIIFLVSLVWVYYFGYYIPIIIGITMSKIKNSYLRLSANEKEPK